MIADVFAALFEIFTPPFRSALWKVLGVTFAVLLLAVVGLHRGLIALVHLPYPWLQAAASLLAGLGLVAGSVFLVAPVSALVAGFFVDEMAERVERHLDPLLPPGRALPVIRSIWMGLRFALLSLVVLLIALVLLLLPGINAVAFLGANSYLLGRQYFEFAALRFRPADDVRLMWGRHWLTIMAGGLCIALFVSVPVLNLLTPLFGTALMVRLHRRLSAGEPWRRLLRTGER